MLVRNVIQWIHWFAVLAQFKMQFVTVGVGIAQVGNGLTAFYSVIFFHQQALVVTIGGEEDTTNVIGGADNGEAEPADTQEAGSADDGEVQP